MRHRRVAAATAVALLALGIAVVPAAPAVADSADVRRQLTEVTERLHAAEARTEAAADQLHGVERRITGIQAEQRSITRRVADRIRLVYMSGLGADTIEVMISSPDPMVAVERMSLMDAATRSDDALLRRSQVLARELRTARETAARVSAEATAAHERLEQEGRALAALFARLAEQERIAAAKARQEALAQARARRLAAERAAERARSERERASALAAARRAERAARAASRTTPSVGTGGMHCLVGPVHSFADTYGAPRSGGRRHQGVDVFAPRGSPSYAVTSGVVTRAGNNRLGGLMIYLRGDNGVEYYYAHFASLAVSPGQRVAAGALVGRVGTSGNAEGTSPHVHFEMHPGGGRPVNPTPFVRRICG